MSSLSGVSILLIIIINQPVRKYEFVSMKSEIVYLVLYKQSSQLHLTYK